MVTYFLEVWNNAFSLPCLSAGYWESDGNLILGDVKMVSTIDGKDFHYMGFLNLSGYLIL